MTAAEDFDDGDLGLFGPDSVTWRVHADPLLGLAGLRALLLQALHPVAMAVIHETSDFKRDAWGRLFRTAEYVGVTTYGTTDQARRMAARIRGGHRKIRMPDPVTGAEVRANQPELLLWVHACLVDSFLSTVRRGGLRLSDADADRYVTEQVRMARLAGIRGVDVPRTVADLAGYFADMRPELRATRAAREAVLFVLLPPMPVLVQVVTPARPLWASAAGLAFATLPPWARRQFQLPGLPTTDVAAVAALRALRLSLLAVPPAVRDGPHLKQAQRRVARA
jgi:uncharacterized protein (DUF2236 family)